ncbi:LysR family transcriptional regulator [Bradyrhizobium arachidis]|nr:LysR family transcriptional regulator [Bradyrhizobium arachidis]
MRDQPASSLSESLTSRHLYVKYLADTIFISLRYGMERRHLRYLLALSEEGSFTRAAERVGIAQPPFSKQIRDMEHEIGAALVERLPRGAVLTEAGHAFVARARAIEDAFAAAVDEARRIGTGHAGRLRVGFTETGIFHPRVVACFLRFRQRYPGVELVLEEQLSVALVSLLREGRLDAAFIRPPLPTDDGWERRAFASEPLVVAIPKGHRLAARRTVRLTDLRDEPFVFYHRRVRPGLTDTIISACERAGFTPRESQIVTKIPSALRLVAAGAGVAIVPASMSRVGAVDLRFLALGDRLSAEIALIWRKDCRSMSLPGFVAETERVR